MGVLPHGGDGGDSGNGGEGGGGDGGTASQQFPRESFAALFFSRGLASSIA